MQHGGGNGEDKCTRHGGGNGEDNMHNHVVEDKLTRKWYSSGVIEIECSYKNLFVIKCGPVNHKSKDFLQIKTQCSGIRENVLVRL